MTTCNRSGACCTFDGKPCGFLTTDNRCDLYPLWGSLRDIPEWRAAPVGQWFTRNHPGFECRDWPQRIPAVMGNPTAGLCCWEVTRGDAA